MPPPTSFLLVAGISGFGSFANETEVKHSQHIQFALLKVLINANQLHLQVGAAEKDSVLFYAEDRVPPPLQILAQAQRMLDEFHHWIAGFATARQCLCRACRSIDQLRFKLIAHAGQWGFTAMLQQLKPLDESVIALRRLLKHNMPSQGHILLTESLLAQAPATPDFLGSVAQRSAYTYAELGKTGFMCISLHETVSVPAHAWDPRLNFRKSLFQLRQTLADRLIPN